MEPKSVPHTGQRENTIVGASSFNLLVLLLTWKVDRANNRVMEQQSVPHECTT